MAHFILKTMETITLYRQIHPAQCPTIKALGYQTLINLRLDDECPNQPCTKTLALASQKAGLGYHHLPIDGECLLDGKNVRAFAELINQSPKPVMVFCGTGGRAKRLYQSAKIAGLLNG